ncbi:phosphatase PAP2 family protein [Ohtaekwangia sp.]|uniref:phosphatase PAP2 family protein n=1 Tax=Ohtaekwangia sp. TaxID=2066019 RepID=UPI002FDCEA1F
MRISLAQPNISIARLYLVILLLLFTSAILIDKGDDVLWINGHHSPWLDLFFRTITNLGDGAIFVPIIILALFIRFRYAIIGLIASIAHGLIVSLFKHVFFPGMERPKNFLHNDLLYFVPGVEVHGTNSFPSGHTATAFCAALFLAFITRNKVIGTFTLLLAFLVGYSRIYLAQHFLVDVAAGAIIGCFTTYIVWQIMELSNTPTWMNRRLTISRLKVQRVRFKV